MGRILLIAQRELRSTFVSPVMWFALALAWLLEGGMAYLWSLPASGGEVSRFIYDAASRWLAIQLLVVPVLCMRILSEEKRSGTFETLMTAPVADHEVVIGKFMAVWVVHAIAALIVPMLALTLIPYGGRPDPGQLIAAYLSLLGTGSVFLAIGVFASSLTQAQVLAAFISLILQLVMFLGPPLVLQQVPPEHPIALSLLRGSLATHVQAGSLGILDGNDFTYQLVMTALFLLFAVRSLEVRKWR